LLPRDEEKADYFRMLFFAAGPLEQAVTNKAYGWNPDQKQEMSVGFGNYERTIDFLGCWFAARDFVCGQRFTMADVYVGSAIDWGMQFGTIPAQDSLTAYAERVRAREAYQAGKAIDNALIAEMQATQPA
jgi:glutathione S-transferase